MEMYRIENINLIDFLCDKIEDLISSSCLFFEYLLIPREGYLLISKENMENKDGSVSEPLIGGTLINYVIYNILGYSYTKFPYYTIYTSSIIDEYLKRQKIDISSVQNKYSAMFENKLSLDVKAKIREIYKEEPYIEYIKESVYTPIDNYILWLVSTIIENIDNLNNDSIIVKNIDIFNNLEGNNTFYPKDYNFYENDQNILTQSLIWILCGLNDWLEKNIITYTDIIFLNKILTPISNKLIADKNLSNIQKDDLYNNVMQNLKSAIFSNDFFISEKALEKLTNLFINISTQMKDNPSSDLFKRVKLLSIII
jgi:hypothetical protein